MITIKIRDRFTAEGAKLGEVSFSEIDALIGRLKQEGVHVIGNDTETTHDIYTQWVVDENASEAYLEVIVGEKE